MFVHRVQMNMFDQSLEIEVKEYSSRPTPRAPEVGCVVRLETPAISLVVHLESPEAGIALGEKIAAGCRRLLAERTPEPPLTFDGGPNDPFAPEGVPLHAEGEPTVEFAAVPVHADDERVAMRAGGVDA